MNVLNDLFLKEHYDECLEQLDNIFIPDRTLIDSLIVDNNKCVCQCQINLVHDENHEKSHQDFNKLIENITVLLQPPNTSETVELYFTILFNCQWYAAATLNVSPISADLWEGYMIKTSSFLRACTGENTLFSTNSSLDPVNEFLQVSKTASHKLQKSNSTACGIFLELLALTTLNILSFNKGKEDEEVLSFINTLLKDSNEFIAINTINEESKISPKLSIMKFGLECGPSLLENVDIPRGLSMISLLGRALHLDRNLRIPNCPRPGIQDFWQPVWLYSEAIYQFQKNEYHKSLALLKQSLTNTNSLLLQCSCHCLLGKVYSAMEDRYKALENFTIATKLDKYHSAAYYYQGREYGKMGLSDAMLKSYQNLVMATKKRRLNSTNKPVQKCLLKLLDNNWEISKVASIYLLSVSYGINEMFDESSLAFEKLLSIQNLTSIVNADILSNDLSSELRLPQPITILHEAAAINLLTGNLLRAEHLCRQAITIHPTENASQQPETDVHGTKDIHWINNILEEFQMNVEQPADLVRYYEQYLSIFDVDVIGLLILADIQRIQDSEESRFTLNNVLLQLSKYIAKSQKASPPNQQLALVKALTAKTCLKIARSQTGSKPFADVDKMFKRALSCNNGDKDVLYHYASFLITVDKIVDAEKLWNTFFEKEQLIQMDQVQSLALRYILRTQISQKLISSLSTKLRMQT